MTRLFAALALIFMTTGALAQDDTIPDSAEEGVVAGTGAVLRGLDKVNAQFQDIEILNGSSVRFKRLIIDLGECRYPEGNPAGDAYAYLTIRDEGSAEPVFQGWMLASSPALSALDHSRYDVWVLRCKTS
ncbi:DUF2155 domain-containing protein [Thalassovita sp.]|uniref:DUF2155 domain-containing protein n=1 Tax=Thalassovita sp. TaxID=1979401 RepID=UPI002880C1A2|nr:DUF2155 domain-containing protein [Thalassovita sp.]MDF1803138.1 DUF2155 domain-containing protein [Thalassovita sp.]